MWIRLWVLYQRDKTDVRFILKFEKETQFLVTSPRFSDSRGKVKLLP